MKFKSRKDWWLTLIVWLAMMVALGSGLYELIYRTPSFPEFLAALFLSVFLPLFILWMWLTTYYVINENHLVIRFDPFKKMVPLESIKSVKKTMNPISSPALSLKRIEIVYDQYNTVLISPIDRDEFIKVLLKQCKDIKIF